MSRETSATAVPLPVSARNCVRMTSRNIAGLVRDAGLFRQARRDSAPILLFQKNLQHLSAGILRVGPLLGDQSQKLQETVGGDLIIQAGVEGRLILDAAQNPDAVDFELVERLLNGLNSDDIDQKIGGQVARLRDHPVRQ